MRIAIHNAQISHYMGGTERLINEQIKGLIKYPDVDLTLITSKTKNPSHLYLELQSIIGEKFRILEFPGIENSKINSPFNQNSPNKWNLESFIFGIEPIKFYNSNNFDLVITHYSTDSSFVPWRKNNLLHLHGAPLNSSDLDKISLERPNVFITDSNYIKSRWIELYPELAKKQIKTIYPGIDASKFLDLNLKRKTDVIFTGRLINIKGIDYLLEAINLINPELNARIIGDGPNKDSLLEKISELKLNNTQIVSGIKDTELVKLYNESKIAVFPSYAKEGMILAMLEAASCGCAIITSNACSMPELIKDKINGLLTIPKDSLDLSKKINLLLTDEIMRNTLKIESSSEIRLNWDNSQRIDELYSFYKSWSKKYEQN
jgi:glycosyltransferase involved in cell wall biosynthesis